jgi:hypothetical protein
MMHQRRFTKEFEVEAVRQVQTAGEASVRSSHIGRTTARGAQAPSDKKRRSVAVHPPETARANTENGRNRIERALEPAPSLRFLPLMFSGTLQPHDPDKQGEARQAG